MPGYVWKCGLLGCPFGAYVLFRDVDPVTLRCPVLSLLT
jgi:hypothetical protein